MPKKYAPVYDIRGLELQIGDYVVGEYGYMGMTVGIVQDIKKMVKIAPNPIRHPDVGCWFPATKCVKVERLPFSPTSEVNTHDFGE